VGVRAGVGGGDADREVAVSLHTPVLSVYLSFDLPRRVVEVVLPWRLHEFDGEDRAVKITEERELSLVWHNGGLWGTIWMHPHDWSSREPKWRRWTLDPARLLCGRNSYSSRVLSEQRVLIPMPEKPYPATVVLTEDSWKRPRWPYSRRIKRAQVTPDEGIPSMGKGENVWDCGPDGTYGLTCAARTVEQAVGAMVEVVYRERRRYGIVESGHAITAPTESSGLAS
jgi:hypothetical protein